MFKKLVVRIGVSILSTLIILLCFELIIRSTHMFGARLSWSEPDTKLAYRYTPNSKYWNYLENDHAVSGRINKYGWRDRDWDIEKPAGAVRIAVLGDSYVEAFQVEEDSTFLSIVERRFQKMKGLQYELMNFGRTGFTQSEEYLVLLNDVLKFNPDRVLLFFLPDNDISEIIPELAINKTRPFFKVESDGSLFLDTSFVHTDEFNYKIKINPYKQNSALLSLLAERYNAMIRQNRREAVKKATYSRGIGDDPDNPKYRIKDFLNLASSNPDLLYQKAYKLNKHLISEMSKICRSRDIEFTLVLIGGWHAMDIMTRGYRKIDPDFNPDWFNIDLDDFCREIEVDFIRLQTIFSDKIDNEGADLFWTHWNYAGHRLVAEVIGDYLERRE